MSNYVEYKGRVAFHPGYYIEEIVDESGLSQQDFAKKLDTTPKNLSKLINGQQSLSVDMAVKLSRMLGTSLEYWLNLQNAYDSALVEFNSEACVEQEKKVLRTLRYGYFQKYFGLPDLPRQTLSQVDEVRKFLKISSLNVLKSPDLSVSFRSSCNEMDEDTICRANALVQIAVNSLSGVDAPKYDRGLFKGAVEFALSQTTNHDGFLPLVREALLKAGVVLVVLPNLPGSKVNGATKKIGSCILLMVNDRRHFADTFWFSLFHEMGHILNDDFGVSFEHGDDEKEVVADKFAADSLIPANDYARFVSAGRFEALDVVRFAEEIDRDPGIVVGRLENDGHVRHGDRRLSHLRHRYEIVSK